MLTPIKLRDAIRSEGIRLGLRGFVRFAPEGGPLLVTDMLLRADREQRAAFTEAMVRLGCVCCEKGPLLGIDPGDALTEKMCREAENASLSSEKTGFDDGLALAERWLAYPCEAVTEDGKRLILETMRLAMVTPPRFEEALWSLRRRGAEAQRLHQTSGMHRAGAVLRMLILERRSI